MTERAEGSVGADQLIVRRDGGIVQTVNLTMDVLTIGRFPDNGLVLADQHVSRDHAVLRREGDTFVLVDKSSTGTLVDGILLKKDEPHHLSPSEEIKIGPFVLTYKAQPTVVRTLRPDGPPVPQIQVLNRRRQVVQVAEIQSPGSSTVGRGKDSFLVLDSRYVSREHLRVDWDGRRVTVTDLDSSNGTWLEKTQLPKRQPVPWEWGQVLRTGPYFLRLDRVRRTDRIDVSLDKSAMTLKPSQPDVLNVTLANLGETVDHLTLMVQGRGVRSEWWSGPEQEVQLNPRVRTTVPLSVHVPNKPDSRAGDYAVQVRARSRENPAESGFADGSWTVLPYVDDALELSPGRVAGRLRGTYDVVLRNGGNAPVKYDLGASDEDKALKYAFKTPAGKTTAVALEPGDTARIALQVRPPLRLTGPTQQRSFQVQALPEGIDKPRQAAVVFAQLALIPAWVIWAMTRVAPIIAVLGFLYFFALPPTPSLDVVGERKITEGDPVVLSWATMRMDRAELVSATKSADGQQLDDSQAIGQASGKTAPMFPDDNTTYKLRVRNILGMWGESNSVTVSVDRKPGMPRLTVTEPEKLASEKDPVKIAWSEQEATRITIAQKWDGTVVYQTPEGDKPDPAGSSSLSLPPGAPPDGGYAYVVTAYNDDANPVMAKTRDVKVVISPPPAPLPFDPSAPQVYAGAAVVLTFTQPASATRLELKALGDGEIEKGKGGTVDVTNRSQYTVYPTKSTNYDLIAWNAGGQSAASHTNVKVLPIKIISFTTGAPTLIKGEATTFTWEVEAAPQSDVIVAIEPDIGPVGLKGSIQVEPTKAGSLTYWLRVRYADGSVAKDGNATLERSVKLTVNPGPVKASITGPPEVEKGQSVTLSLGATGATRVKLEQLSADKANNPVVLEKNVDASGYTDKFVAKPSETSIFRLTATNGPSKDVFELVVTVTEPEAQPTPVPSAPAPPSGLSASAAAVKYVTQLDGSELQNSNCGPASLAMELSAFGRTATAVELRKDVDAVDKSSDPKRGSSWWALSSAARKRGLLSNGLSKRWKIEDLNSSVLPLIALTRYQLLPDHYSSKSTSDHYIVLLSIDAQGNVIYHDPWRNGAYRKMTQAQLKQAWSNATPPWTGMYLTSR